ncbi:hypothetical protein HYFRA_00002871 [Hymenoscyphus fraxineus]|uniref:Mediator complex subunit 15 KIX domain-containing protein n=1 Tax=Hymenoscyphus fraxineus TaxID=746836 RepID=A0A9N9PL35_9HELO|nr:hypothetical protein HYFRA_00002871 [Hymenoscyphus fraxineus]
MAQNFQPHMGGGPGQMMQQRPPQQRPPQSALNATQHIQQLIYSAVTAQTGPITGWQTQVLIQERIGLILNIIGNLRLASQNQTNAPQLNKMIEIGIKFEKEIYENSNDKTHYKQQVEQKLELLLEHRNKNQAGLQNTINQQAQAQAQQQAQQQMMMNQNGMQGQAPRSMAQQPAQQGFQHLQHQMQASPLPGQQLQQPPMGMVNGGMPQNMVQNQQQQFQFNMQQKQNNLNRPPNQQQMTPEDQAFVLELSSQLMNRASVEDKNQLRHRLVSTMPPQQLNEFQMRGQDPLVMYYRQQAIQRIRQEKASKQRMAQAQQLAMSQQNPNMSNVAPPMQHQLSANPNLNGQSQPPGAMGNGDQFGNFMGSSMNDINQQQQQGVIAAGEGQVVVPATNGQRNATPQPGVMAGQVMGMNPQGMVNPNQRTQQQQQQLNLNAQQLQQQQRLHAAQQQQQQNQAVRKQMELQGQRDMMGNGPMPPQQSPGLSNLTAPMRTPSQRSHSDVPQPNPAPQFGNPQFNQGTPQQRMTGDPRMNHPMIQGMNAEQRQKVLSLPPDKLNELLTKWTDQRAMNANGVRPPQMGNQGNGAMPGQPMPGQQFNGAMAASNQFMNNGQRPNQPMQNGNAMTQQLLQQQAMQQNQMQQLGQPPQGPIPLQQAELNVIRQMDNADFPINFQNHGSFPRGVPPEIKKWGQLKMWAQQNPTMGNETQESIKQLQKIHWQTLMRNKQTMQQQVAMQSGVPPRGLQPGQNPMSSIPQNIGGAPVAPMTMNNPQQGPTIRQPTQQDIQAARNHPSGKMAAASDDQIRIFLVRQQAIAHQQRSLMQNMQMQNQMTNMGQPRPGQPQANLMNARLPNHPPPAQAPQAKPAPPNTENVNASRAARPAANAARAANAPPSSSPAPPPKNNLKRASSDDVVEVPNPNIQQPSRPASQTQAPQGQGQQSAGQQARPVLTPQQVAALDPEARKRYELNARNAQASARLLAIMREEAEKAKTKTYAEIPMNAEMKNKVTRMLREVLLHPLNNMTKALPRWYQITQDDDRARKFCALKHRLAKEFDDPQMGKPKENLSMDIQEIEVARAVLNGMVNDLSTRYPNMLNKTKAPQDNQPAQAQTSQPPAAVPLNAANLQEQQQQLNKLHQRTNSRQHAPPAAPTSTQPPFQFGAKSPPDGVPAYIGKNTLTQESLHLPARKKQKQNQATQGPSSSPQVAKAPSPATTKQPVKPKTQARPTLCCKETDCDRHTVGFETEEELKAHTEEEHVKPLSDPMQYAQQNLASLLGLDPQGQPKKQVMSQEQPVPVAAPKMMASGSKQGQTPTMKAPNTPAAATPMIRQVSMNRQSSAPGARPGTPSKATSSKDTAKATPGQDQNKRATQPPQEIAVEDPWANTTIDPNDLFQTFQTFETGAGGAISDMSVYSSITPNDTPESSKDGVSEPNSDISDGVNLDISIDLFDDNWMPFGPSEMDTMFDLNNFGVAKDEDILMFDDQQPTIPLSWDDVVDQSAFDKPFVFDTSLYSMDAS